MVVTLVMAPKSVRFRRHDHLVSVLFGDLLSHSYNITFSMFLYLVVYHCTHFLYSMDSKELVSVKQTSGFVTVSGQCVDVIQPLHEEDSIHFKYLYLHCSCLFLIVLSGCVLCMYIGA